MRHVLFCTLFLLAMPVFAQEEPVPDTTEAWLYYPLAVGNVWEYFKNHPVGEWAYLRSVIPRDTVIEGKRYFIREGYSNNPLESTVWEYEGYSIVRFDTLSARLVVHEDEGDDPSGCPFNADFGSVISCEGMEGEYEVGGGYRTTVLIGQDVAPVSAEKWFTPVHIPWDGPTCSYVGSIGFFGCEGFSYPGIESYDLRYTRLVRDGDVVEYGAPVPVSSEPMPEPSVELTLAAYPNPFTEAVTLRLAVPSPQRVTVEVFDALGRRVHTEERTAGGTARIRLDASGWPSGLYLVRLGTAGGQTATMPVVKR